MFLLFATNQNFVMTQITPRLQNVHNHTLDSYMQEVVTIIKETIVTNKNFNQNKLLEFINKIQVWNQSNIYSLIYLLKNSLPSDETNDFITVLINILKNNFNINLPSTQMKILQPIITTKNKTLPTTHAETSTANNINLNPAPVTNATDPINTSTGTLKVKDQNILDATDIINEHNANRTPNGALTTLLVSFLLYLTLFFMFPAIGYNISVKDIKHILENVKTLKINGEGIITTSIVIDENGKVYSHNNPYIIVAIVLAILFIIGIIVGLLMRLNVISPDAVISNRIAFILHASLIMVFLIILIILIIFISIDSFEKDGIIDYCKSEKTQQIIEQVKTLMPHNTSKINNLELMDINKTLDSTQDPYLQALLTEETIHSEVGTIGIFDKDLFQPINEKQQMLTNIVNSFPFFLGGIIASVVALCICGYKAISSYLEAQADRNRSQITSIAPTNNLTLTVAK